MGKFLPQIPQFENTNVWSILKQYLNPAMNEMFTCLRTNGDGQVVPTLVVRQLPFSSPLVKLPFPVTRFLDLPRWRAHPILVRQASVGRSDSLRINWVQCMGLAPEPVGKNNATAQLVRNPPYRDDLDVARSGLRPYKVTIPCALEDVRVRVDESGATAAKNWNALLADILMGQHLTLTGSVTLAGIQAPICIGDNFEWDGVVFHIEAVTHSCSENTDGKRSFSTTLQLSHGVRAQPGEDDISLFAGIRADDMTAFNPGVTDEGQNLGNTVADLEGTATLPHGLEVLGPLKKESGPVSSVLVGIQNAIKGNI
jgi:hypothetical protein